MFMDQGKIVEDALKDDFFGKPRSDRAQEFLSKILSHQSAIRKSGYRFCDNDHARASDRVRECEETRSTGGSHSLTLDHSPF